MFWLIKQMFITFINFSGSLATKCVSLNNEPCMTRPTLIGLNPIELKYYPFMVRLDKCDGSCNVVDDLSTKICVLIKTIDVNFKVFNTKTRINDEVKASLKHISRDFKCKLESTICNSSQN